MRHPLNPLDPAPHPWRALDAARLAEAVPAHVRPWLDLSTSMTRRLEDSLGSGIRVEVLRSGPGRLNPDEAGFFGAEDGEAPGGPADGSIHVREVCLHGAGRPVLAARTVYPASRPALTRNLASLGDRPLGELLFSADRPATWTRREIARLDGAGDLRDLVACQASRPALPCWARRTLFELAGEPLLVTEIFLPPVPAFAPAGAQAGRAVATR